MAGCLNGGSCLFDKEKEAFACSCNPQWSGESELGKFLVFFVPYSGALAREARQRSTMGKKIW